MLAPWHCGAEPKGGVRVLRQTTSYDRTEMGSGAVAWIYEYWNAQKIESAGMGAGLEIGVQLEGDWLHDGAAHGKVLYTPGTIHRIDPAEPYRTSFSHACGRGVQIGFIVYPKDFPELGPVDGDLRFAGDSGERDPRFVEFCRWFRANADRATCTAEAREQLRGFLARHAVLSPRDRLSDAKDEIDATLPTDMSMIYFADVAGMHPETFARAFRRRFGTTPAHYRLQARLNLAAKLAWARPDWSFARIAEDTGFGTASYLHRSFYRAFGRTPAEWARRTRAPGQQAAA